MGYQLLSIPLAFEETNVPTVNERTRRMQAFRDEALRAHEIARNRIAQRINSNFKPFQIGDKVWLDTRNLQMKINSKLKPKREGPFEIERLIGKVSYQLRLPPHWRIHPVFHATLLKPYKETEQYGPNIP